MKNEITAKQLVEITNLDYNHSCYFFRFGGLKTVKRYGKMYVADRDEVIKLCKERGIEIDESKLEKISA